MVAEMRVLPEVDEGSQAWWARVTTELRQPFPMEMVEFRLGAKVGKDDDRHMIYAYITAPGVRARFDRVIPGLFSNDFREFQDVIECTITVAGQHRTDVGFVKPPSPKEESAETRLLGARSHAFKRAGRAWGVGDYLENFPVTILEMGGSKYLSRQQIGDLQRRYYTWVHSAGVRERFGAVYEEEGSRAPTGEMPRDEDVAPPVDPVALAKQFAVDIEDATSVAELRQISAEIKAAAGTLPDDVLQALRAAYRAKAAAMSAGAAESMPVAVPSAAPSVMAAEEAPPDQHMAGLRSDDGGGTSGSGPEAAQADPVPPPAIDDPGPPEPVEAVGRPSVRAAPPAPQAPPTQKACPDCGSPMRVRSGRSGAFWGCSGYPDCKHTEPGGDAVKVNGDTYALAPEGYAIPPPLSSRSRARLSRASEPAPLETTAPAAAGTAEAAERPVSAVAMDMANRLLTAHGDAVRGLLDQADALGKNPDVPVPTQYLLQQLVTTKRGEIEEAQSPDGPTAPELPLADEPVAPEPKRRGHPPKQR